MQKIRMSLVIIAACALSGIFNSCLKDYSAEIANAQHDAVVNEWHVSPMEGIYANAEVVFRCLDSFTVEYMGEHYESSHYCRSTYLFHGGDVTENVADLSGCYDVDRGGNVVGTNLSLTFEGDQVEPAMVQLVGIPDPVDFSSRFQPCHYEPFKICFDTEAKKIRIYGVNQTDGDTAISIGDWYGLIVKTDTMWRTVHDTTFLWRTDTVYRVVTDTVIMGGDTTTYTFYILRNHAGWNGVNAGYVSGTDSVRVVKLDANGAVIGIDRGTYQHRTPMSYNVPSVMPREVAGNCYNFVNGSANCAGTTATCNLGNTQVVGPVIIGGMDITNYLQGCHPYAQRICFGNLSGNSGQWTVYIVGPEGDQAATITGTYTTQTQRTLDSVVVRLHHNGVNPIDVISTASMYSQCNNRTDSVFYWSDGTTTNHSVNWSKRFNRSVTINGTYTTAYQGRRVPISAAGVADFGDGFSVTFGTVTPSYPQGHAAEGATLDCTHHFVWAEATASGVVEHGYVYCAHEGLTDSVQGTIHITPVTPPTPPDTIPDSLDFPGVLLAVYITDSYTGNGAGHTTHIVGLWNDSGVYTLRHAPIASCSNASSWHADNVTATGYTTFNTNKTNANWALAYITTSGASSHAGYLTHNTDPSTGDYWYTINDGTPRNHCNVGGYANGWDGHSPIHYRNISGGLTHVHTTVHEVYVNVTLQ